MREVWTGFTSLGDADTRRAFLATTRAVIDPGGQSVTAHDYLPEATQLPTLVVWGTRDRMIPAWHAAAATTSIEHCRVELFQGAGHFPHLDDPDRFADLVREFVAEARLSGRAPAAAQPIWSQSVQPLCSTSQAMRP